jgi:PAS domain S-box-containing protein
MRIPVPLPSKGRKFQALFEEHPQAMWVYDPATAKIIEANSAACALYGYTPAAFREMDLGTIQPTEAARELFAGTRAHRTKSGRMIEVETTSRPINHSGRPAELVFITDTTLRRELEEQLRQARKMEAVGMLAGGVAHDFNNLLTIIAGYSQLIFNNLSEEDPNRRSAGHIMKASERAAALTGQLLAFSRRQTPAPKMIDVNQLVSGMNPMLNRLIGEDIELQLTLRPELGQVKADAGQLEQVVMNLVVNARDAMPKGGVLTIETANVHLDENYSCRQLAVKPGAYTLMAVSDNGTGMDEATRARLFEPFFTTKGKGNGTGLGLSTVFGIVKQARGTVEVYSVPGQGTSVKVYLPRVDQKAPAEPKLESRTVSGGTETILLVEDEEMVRNLIRETLVRGGYKVIDAATPGDARRLAAAYKQKIHLMITDVVMPKVSGRELAQQLAGERPEMKVLYISGYTDSAVVNSGILQKEVAFLQKPFTLAGLGEKVRDVLEDDSGNNQKRTRKAGS